MFFIVISCIPFLTNIRLLRLLLVFYYYCTYKINSSFDALCALQQLRYIGLVSRYSSLSIVPLATQDIAQLLYVTESNSSVEK